MGIIGDIGLGISEGGTQKDAYIAEYKALPPNTEPNTLRVFIARDPFDEWYTLILDNGHTEELEDPETRAWLAARGADEDNIKQTMDQAWNFYRAICIINNPKQVIEVLSPLAPRITPV